MTRAAVYVRVSTDEQALSAEAQERDARRFAEARGWVVGEVYADVGVSGAEWTSRPQLTRMLADAGRSGRGWDVVLLRDLDRLGRDAARTALALEDLHDAGVRVLEYSTGAEVQQDPMGKVLASTRAAFGEYERAMASARTRGAHLDLARRGYVTGGRTYGYRNVRTPEGVLREPDPAEADVVREIYARRIAGETPGAITRELNTRGVPSPRAPGWNLGGVAALLRNPCYKGEIEWGKTRKAYRKGSKVTRTTAPAERLRLTVPALVIVDPETWQAAQWRSPALPRGGRSTHTRNLLSGLLRCAGCGGPAQAQATRWSGAQTLVYRCAWSYQRGVSVCPVRSRKPVTQVDAAVIDWLRTHVLSPEVVAEAVGQAVDQVMSEAAAPDRGAELRAELARVEGEARRLAEALARGGDLEVILTTLRAREDRAKALQVEIAGLGAAEGVRTVGREALEREALSRAADLRELLGRDTAGARKVLAQVVGRLVFTPGEGRGAPWAIEVAGTPETPPSGFDSPAQRVLPPRASMNGGSAEPAAPEGGSVMTVDIRKLFNEEIPAALSRRGDDARKIGGKYQLNIANAGNWGVDLVSDPPSVIEGTLEGAGVTIDVLDTDFQTLVSDPSAGMKLFFAGKLKVKGNQMLAMNLQKLFGLMK